MTKALQIYDRKAVEAYAVQLVESMPGSRRLELPQALALAQICHIHGLDAYNGEAWFIPGSGVMVGIKGLRKLARKQLSKESSDRANYWTQFHRATQPAKYDAGPKDLVEICELRDSESIAAWSEAMQKLLDLGLDPEIAQMAAGAPPVTIGVGVVKDGEKSVMPRKQLAMKRAEAHAIKQRFDVEFDLLEDAMQRAADNWPTPEGLQQMINQPDEDVIDAESEEIPEDAPPLRPYTAHFLRAKIQSLAADRNAINAQCSKPDRNIVDSAFAMALSKPADRNKVLKWLTGKVKIDSISDGHILALRKWLEVKEIEVTPPEYVLQEIGAVLDEINLEADRDQG